MKPNGILSYQLERKLRKKICEVGNSCLNFTQDENLCKVNEPLSLELVKWSSKIINLDEVGLNFLLAGISLGSFEENSRGNSSCGCM